MRGAVHEIATMLAETDRPYPIWLFSEGPPGPRMNRVNRTAPGAALRIEATLAGAIRERLDLTGNRSGIDTGFLSELLGRSLLALLRSIMIRSSQLLGSGRGLPEQSLIDQAFATMTIPSTRP
jgi:hypothetical protein